MTASRIGDSPARVGGIGRVTGSQQYVADLHPADVLHAKLVTVDAPRARILAITDGGRVTNQLRGQHIVAVSTS